MAPIDSWTQIAKLPPVSSVEESGREVKRCENTFIICLLRIHCSVAD